MTCREKEPSARTEGSETKDPGQGSSGLRIGGTTDTRNAEELLSLGVEPCGEPVYWFSVDVHMHEDVCARPRRHLGPCHYLPITACPHSDDDELCMDCQRDAWEAARADAWREDQALGL